MVESPLPTPHLARVAFSVPDLARAVRFACDGLGYRSAGARYLSGERQGDVQGLAGPACCCWWLIGDRPFFQIELLQYAAPPPMPRPHSWTPADIGYTRLTFAVPDMGAALARLQAAGHPPADAPIILAGTRRACVPDPSGTPVELLEDLSMRSGLPRLAAVGASVPDIAEAAAFFRDTLGLPETEPGLHPPDAEAIWGLPAARRTMLALQAGEVLLELTRYDSPPPAPRRPGSHANDIGILALALGYRDWQPFKGTYDRVVAAGYTTSGEPSGPGDPHSLVHCTGPAGFSVELLYCPASSDAALGFALAPEPGPRKR